VELKYLMVRLLKKYRRRLRIFRLISKREGKKSWRRTEKLEIRRNWNSK
jgi:hypothetical protein